MNHNQAIQMIPLDQLAPIGNGVRKHKRDAGIEELAASIQAEGLLQNLTVARKNGAGNFTVVAGNRRLRALQRLAVAGTISPRHEVPCRVVEQEAALTASLAENAMREAMHPADEFEAFRDILAQGRSIEEVAHRFGVTPLVVQRRLRLANVAPALITEFRQGNATLDQMMALAIVDDHKAQLAAWKAGEKQRWLRGPIELRRALTKAEIDITEDPVAQFVGREDFERAGGVVRTDLFSANGGGGFVQDATLLNQVAMQKLDTIAHTVRAEGWSWVEIRPGVDYAELMKFTRAEPKGKRKATAEEKKRVEELVDERKTIDARLTEIDGIDEANEATDEIDAERERLDDRRNAIATALRDLDEARATWAPEVLEKCGALVYIEFGRARIVRGLGKGKLKLSKGAQASPAADGDEKPAKGKAKHSEALMREMTASTGFALANAMIDKPTIAMIALTHRLALRQFYPGSGIDGRSAIRIEYSHGDGSQDRHAQGLGTEYGAHARGAILAERTALEALLPKKADDLFGWLMESMREFATGSLENRVLRVLAFCVAESVNVITGDDQDKSPAARELAQALNLSMTATFNEVSADYFKRISREQLTAAAKDAGVDKKTIAAFPKKKAELVEAARAAILPRNWLPKFYRLEKGAKS